MKMLLALAVVAFVGVQDSTVYSPGNGVSLPQVTRQVKADYTDEAKAEPYRGQGRPRRGRAGRRHGRRREGELSRSTRSTASTPTR